MQSLKKDHPAGVGRDLRRVVQWFSASRRDGAALLQSLHLNVAAIGDDFPLKTPMISRVWENRARS